MAVRFVTRIHVKQSDGLQMIADFINGCCVVYEAGRLVIGFKIPLGNL